MTAGPDLEFDDLELRYWSPSDLWGQHDELLVEQWDIEIVWQQFDDSFEVHEMAVGRGRAVVVDLFEAGQEFGGVAGALDAISGDLAEFGVIYDPETGDWPEDLELLGAESAALIVDNITIEPAVRGRGLGPLLLAAIIRKLGRGCALAAIYPCPVGDPANGKSRPEAIAALERTWQTVGFRPYRGGVWVLELAARTFDDCWARLRSASH